MWNTPKFFKGVCVVGGSYIDEINLTKFLKLNENIRVLPPPLLCMFENIHNYNETKKLNY